MAEIICLVCGESNPAELEFCRSCNSPLPKDLGPIQPGQAPTPIDTGKLEPILPQWLRDAREQARQTARQEPPPPPPSPTPPPQEPTDLLAGLQSQAADEEEEEIPEWLRSLAEGESQPAASQPEEEPGAPSQAGFPPPAGSPPSPPMGEAPASADLPDWFSALTPSQESTPSRDEFAEWFAQASASEPSESEQQPTGPAAEPPAAPREEPAAEPSLDLDWLRALESAEKGEAESLPAVEALPGEEIELPDWLKDLPSAAPAAKAELPPEEEALPAWLQEPGKTTEPSSPLEEAALPDWLQGLSAEPAAPQAPTPEEEPPSPAAPAFIAPPPIPTSELHIEPDWLAGLRAQESEMPAAETAPEAPAEEPKPAFAEAPLSAEGMEEIFAADLPDWLLSTAEMPPAEEGLTPEESEEALAPAELPSWLQAMRPVEATLEEGAEIGASEVQEEQGPLAGLRGVLPVPLTGISSPKPRPVSLKLQVTEEQQSHMALLDQILAAETTPQPLQSPPAIRPLRLLRWVIAALLIGLTALIFFGGSRFFAVPAFQPSVFAARDVIAALPEGAPVLVVFEYQPALSGELEAVAAPFIDSLIILRHPRLVFVSTSPLGADLAERFLSRTQQEHGYQSRAQYLNLGYLPGGLSGVRAFVQNPVQAVPFATDLAPAWESQPLQGVQSFSDFAAVLIITDNVESGRLWVEQSQSVRGSTPLILISSAQAGPLLQPYYQSGQVTGLLSGLYDGAVMERNNADRPGLVRRYWDAYSLGLWLAILMMSVGAAWNFVLGWRERSAAVEME